MSQHTVTLGHHFRAPIDKVFDALADHERFGQIWPGRTTRIRDGKDSPNGLGSVRRIKAGPISLEETTVTLERPQVIEYTITNGTPLRNHLGRIELTADESGTRMHYVIRYECRLAFVGRAIEKKLEKDFYRGIAPWTAAIESES